MEILTILGAAFLGGFFLNLVPCILPVLSLKVLNFIKMAGGSPRVRIAHGLVYFLGILISFLILGLITVFIKMAGGAVIFGGFMLSSTWFNLALGMVIGALGARLTFKGTGIARWAENAFTAIKLAVKSNTAKIPPHSLPKSGENGRNTYPKVGKWALFTSWAAERIMDLKMNAPLLGSFMHGCLTTLMGSACCGPMLAYAMGIALAASPMVIMGAFFAAGLGMGIPYFLLGCFPCLTTKIPKTGKWIVWVERSSGVAMLLTALWFFYLGL